MIIQVNKINNLLCVFETTEIALDQSGQFGLTRTLFWNPTCPRAIIKYEEIVLFVIFHSEFNVLWGQFVRLTEIEHIEIHWSS